MEFFQKKLRDIAQINIVYRSLFLAAFYAIFWIQLDALVIQHNDSWLWIFPKLLVSFIIFFTFNGLFASFEYYRWSFPWKLLTAGFYVHPFFQLFYYQTYKAFLEQQNLSLIIREPLFLIKVLAMEMSWSRFFIFLISTMCFFILNKLFLYRENLLTRKNKPYDFFLNKWTLLFNALMIYLQIRWCLDHDTSQLMMRPFYPITLLALISVFIHLTRTHQPRIFRITTFTLIVVNIVQLYALNLSFFDIRQKFSLDSIYFRSLFGAFYVQTVFGSMEQNDDARATFHKLPQAKLDYNILIVLNDGQRWDFQSSQGFEKATDDELEWLLKKSFNFKYPISPANFTDTSVPAIMTGLASDQDVRKIKGSLAVWDYFAKSADTFFISSQDITWSKLNLFYASIGQKYVWSATAQPGYKGNPEDTIDRLSLDHITNYLKDRTAPYVGVWQTFASHAPYTTEPEWQRYKPCDIDRSQIEVFRNCYLNGQVYSAHVRSELFKKIDLQKTVIVMTSDHGEGLGEHGVYYHGVDYHQEMVKVPFVLYIPPALQEKINPQALANLKANENKIISVTDMVPTLLHLHELLTTQKLVEDYGYFTGKSLFESWDHRVVFSSHCFPQYRCYSREIMFADDEYYLIFRPSEGIYKIYSTWGDLKQNNPLDWKKLDKQKLSKLVNQAALTHSAGQSLKAYFEKY